MTRKQAVKEADKWFSILVRKITDKEYGGVCPLCGIRPIQCCFHFVTRSKHIVRWDLRNAIGSCIIDNYKMEFNPHPYILWYIKKHGLEAYEQLINQSSKVANFSTGELKKILQDITDRLEHFK